MCTIIEVKMKKKIVRGGDFFKNFQRAITPKREVTQKRKKYRSAIFFMRNPYVKFQNSSFNG